MGILEHRPQGAAQVVLPDGLDIEAVIGDQTALDLVKAVDEVGDGGLARPSGADKGDLLPRIGVDGHILQNAFSRHKKTSGKSGSKNIVNRIPAKNTLNRKHYTTGMI